MDGSPPGSAFPGILQARTLEWVAISFSNAWKWKVKVKSLSPVGLFATPWTAAHQASPSMGFTRQECWSGVPLRLHTHCLKWVSGSLSCFLLIVIVFTYLAAGIQCSVCHLLGLCCQPDLAISALIPPLLPNWNGHIYLFSFFKDADSSKYNISSKYKFQ